MYKRHKVLVLMLDVFILAVSIFVLAVPASADDIIPRSIELTTSDSFRCPDGNGHPADCTYLIKNDEEALHESDNAVSMHSNGAGNYSCIEKVSGA
jgi:hypothetical protein